MQISSCLKNVFYKFNIAKRENNMIFKTKENKNIFYG